MALITPNPQQTRYTSIESHWHDWLKQSISISNINTTKKRQNPTYNPPQVKENSSSRDNRCYSIQRCLTETEKVVEIKEEEQIKKITCQEIKEEEQIKKITCQESLLSPE